MLFKTFLILFATITLSTCQLADEEESYLFVTKDTLNRYVVQNNDLTIKYSLFNAGQSTVFSVELNDVDSFPTNKFDLLYGTLNPKWERINAPKQSGPCNMTHAVVTYRKSEKTNEIQTAYSSEIGELTVVSSREYDRRFSSHFLDWILFTMMAIPCIAFPFALWYMSKTKCLIAIPKQVNTLFKHDLCDFLGFSTPYWIQIWPRVGDTTFRNLGLWQVCIAGFRNPKNYWGKVFYGCWWLYAREYYQLRRDQILTPPWFTAVQVMACFGLIFNMLSVVAVIVVSITRYRLSRRSMFVVIILSGLACGFNMISIAIFGQYSDAIGGKWMPRPDYTFLSWSYISMFVSTLAAFLCALFMGLELYYVTEAKKYNNEKTFIRHVGNDDQAFVRKSTNDDQAFVRKAPENEQPFVRKASENEQAFIRKAPENEQPFVRKASENDQAFIRKSDMEQAFIRRASDQNNIV
ncbi:unnamed protein product [Didymodactylos carnosus]|uniref:Uncharacterized protein n=1 Tax=Didymodactylos carnosus TaxID=1234261 RepID=A0A813RHB3_9BILA|nr:unnamed protein product [Didymodactylos carnosus]CAF0901237.1 unnamed protein product [Didymodactylos carnosus]CAF3565907.1 unnamed protein product [Didymodactylos carnosus]CAF3681895.1 unnamed protein product [Didymodactylos carnosus]